MTQNLPTFLPVTSTKEEFAESLNIPPEEIDPDLPIQGVTTGLPFLYIPIKSLKTIENMKPNFQKHLELCQKDNLMGYCCFSLETLQTESKAHSRVYVSPCGIDEDPATGTASGGLICYLFKNGILKEEEAQGISFEQGYWLSRPSQISASLTIKDGEINQVWVGGGSVNIQKYTIKESQKTLAE